VPAASHPSIAAALARVGEARADDVVVDPFAGSGLELIERAKLGPYQALIGIDRDERALAAARANRDAAGVDRMTLIAADGLAHTTPGATLILTNPPMGRRLLPGQVQPLLDRFIDHAAAQIAPGGRIVLVSPHPARTAARAAARGLTAVVRQEIDMGGFTAELQRLDARGKRSTR
jgi:23S rRNA G2445 N2-methylase RlmL